MPNLTKQDIDGMVNGMARMSSPTSFEPQVDFGSTWVPLSDACRALYLAAGLTAEGERKPARVRCWLWQQHGKCDRIILVEPNCRLAGVDECFTPGTFVPDGAE